jgi:hypothetical protein
MSKPQGVTYVKTYMSGVSSTVLYNGDTIGTVTPFSMGAGQFGQKWIATTKAGRKSTQLTTRDAAAGWLIQQVG